MEIKIINKSSNPNPEYGSLHAAGCDVRADLQEPIVLTANSRVLIPTGIYMALPVGYEVQVRPRSGLALKHGITVLNTPGTIDADYRGEVGVILINTSHKAFKINPGDRIAQLVFNKVESVEFVTVSNLDNTERSDGGFGHTGVD